MMGGVGVDNTCEVTAKTDSRIPVHFHLRTSKDSQEPFNLGALARYCTL